MEEPNEVGFFWNFFFIEFLGNRLKIFKIRGPALYFFLLELRVPFNSTSGCVNKYSKVTMIFLKKSFELSLGQRSYLVPMFILVPAETDPPTKKRRDK